MGIAGRHTGHDRARNVSGLTITAFAEADRDDVLGLWRRVFAHYTDDHATMLGCIRAHLECGLFVAREDGAFAGTALAGSDGIRGWLHYVAVPPHRRRRGVARALVRHAEAWLAARGITKVNLQVRGDNLEVRRLYEKLGYLAEERLSMGRRLAPPKADPVPAPRSGDPGCLDVVVTFLEMVSAPTSPPRPTPALKLAVLRAENIAIPFYRFLYDEIGTEWVWHSRRRNAMSDAALRALLHDPGIDLFVLYAGGQPGGFVELDRRRHPQDIEIRYFGLMPWLIGRGAGTFFLDWALREAWRHAPQKVIVDTCTLDHPRALALYQRAGFKPVRQELHPLRDPRPLA
jgi:ribosomal protein S18 acetylase RimI-like enzyme